MYATKRQSESAYPVNRAKSVAPFVLIRVHLWLPSLIPPRENHTSKMLTLSRCTAALPPLNPHCTAVFRSVPRTEIFSHTRNLIQLRTQTHQSTKKHIQIFGSLTTHCLSPIAHFPSRPWQSLSRKHISLQKNTSKQTALESTFLTQVLATTNFDLLNPSQQPSLRCMRMFLNPPPDLL